MKRKHYALQSRSFIHYYLIYTYDKRRFRHERALAVFTIPGSQKQRTENHNLIVEGSALKR
jgi:hypothetical protein